MINWRNQDIGRFRVYLSNHHFDGFAVFAADVGERCLNFDFLIFI